MFTKWAVIIIGFAITWRWMSPRAPLTRKKLLEEYDYVIVGAGSAGAILAARLSEDPDVTVALLEAGPDNDKFPATDIPLLFTTIGPDITWMYMTEPQKHACYSLENQVISVKRYKLATRLFNTRDLCVLGHDLSSIWKALLPRGTILTGRVLGGTSSINAMTVVRCSRHDYDRWAEMGNEGWSYEDVLPYFKKIETVTDKNLKESGYRGENGPIQVQDSHTFPEATAAFLEAAESQGFTIGDLNAEEMSNKVMVTQANIGKDGTRQSTAVSYLKPAMSRDNLHVLTDAHVTKLLFEGKRAVGLQYVHNGRLKTVRCRKEIILSAGAIGSPHILLLSGVGPKEHLQDMMIPVVADLPVGENLRDHVHVQPAIVTLEKPAAIVPERLGLLDKLEYHLFGTGILRSVAVFAVAFAHSQHQPDNHHNPYLEYEFFGTMFNDEGARKMFNMKLEIHEALYGGLNGRDGLNLMTALQLPASVGYMRLNSTNPFDHPLIDPNYLAEDIDVEILLDGIRIARKLMSAESLVTKLGAKLVDRIHPNCANEIFDSDEYWRCFIRHNTLTLFHPASTCRMGPATDANSVVDPKLRVHGLDGLRVVDASVMPLITTGNTNFPVMMIAERAADIIKGKI